MRRRVLAISYSDFQPRRSRLWVKRVGFVMSAIYPVYLKQQTFLDPVGTSHLCHNRTSTKTMVPAESAIFCG
jgi:hypothetical protein